jgi:H/ACA ribonucleoprotein complex subunit 4
MAGTFTEKDKMVSLVDLQDAAYFYRQEKNPKFLRYCIQPIENAVRHIPKCIILDTTIKSITHGRDLAIPGIAELDRFEKEEQVVVMTLKGELVAIGTALFSTEDIQKKSKGIAVEINKVFMESQ